MIIVSDDILEYDDEFCVAITGYDRVEGGDNANFTILNDDGN